MVSVVRPSASVNVAVLTVAAFLSEDHLRQTLVDLGRDDSLVRDDLAVLAVERDLGALVRNHRVPVAATDPKVDLARRHLAALGVPPAFDEFGPRERLEHVAPRCIELPISS